MTSIHGRVRRSLPAVVALAAVVALGPGTASAAPRATLAGGDGLLVTGANRAPEMCTLTSIGRDRRGVLVGLTAGHCANTGDAIRPERGRSGVVGTVVVSVRSGNSRAVGGLDYAVIRFDPARVRPWAGSGRTTIVGVGSAPRSGALACTRGRTTGVGCGTVQPPMAATTIVVRTCSQPGDSGAPVIVNGRVVGIVRGSVVHSDAQGYPRCSGPNDAARTPTAATSMTAVLADLNRRGMTGAGFRPV